MWKVGGDAGTPLEDVAVRGRGQRSRYSLVSWGKRRTGLRSEACPPAEAPSPLSSFHEAGQRTENTCQWCVHCIFHWNLSRSWSFPLNVKRSIMQQTWGLHDIDVFWDGRYVRCELTDMMSWPCKGKQRPETDSMPSQRCHWCCQTRWDNAKKKYDTIRSFHLGLTSGVSVRADTSH